MITLVNGHIQQPSGHCTNGHCTPVAQVLHQSVVQHQQQTPTLSRDTAAAINRDDPQKMEMEMAIDTLISPSPIITTNRGNRHRSSSRDSRHTSRNRKS